MQPADDSAPAPNIDQPWTLSSQFGCYPSAIPRFTAAPSVVKANHFACSVSLLRHVILRFNDSSQHTICISFNAFMPIRRVFIVPVPDTHTPSFSYFIGLSHHLSSSPGSNVDFHLLFMPLDVRIFDFIPQSESLYFLKFVGFFDVFPLDWVDFFSLRIPVDAGVFLISFNIL